MFPACSRRPGGELGSVTLSRGPRADSQLPDVGQEHQVHLVSLALPAPMSWVSSNLRGEGPGVLPLVLEKLSGSIQDQCLEKDRTQCLPSRVATLREGSSPASGGRLLLPHPVLTLRVSPQQKRRSLIFRGSHHVRRVPRTVPSPPSRGDPGRRHLVLAASALLLDWLRNQLTCWLKRSLRSTKTHRPFSQK